MWTAADSTVKHCFMFLKYKKRFMYTALRVQTTAKAQSNAKR